MADVRATAEIRLWNETVGAVVELTDGSILFEYADSFRRLGLEISPIHLPTTLRGPVRFDELLRQPAFNGLPGVLADSLPDAFGNSVIRAYYKARGQSDKAMSPVQRLLYVGSRAIGALTFHPAEDLPGLPADEEALEMSRLVADARKILRGDPTITIPEIYRVGASAGGMRPKAIVLYDPQRETIRSGTIEPEPNEIPCILKFDGAGDGVTADRLGEPLPHNRVEAAYGLMARAAGVDTTEIKVMEQEEYAHLLIHRFDLDNGIRLHQHSLGGLIHVDFNRRGASSYEEYLRTVLLLGMPNAPLEQAYRRLVFNVLAVNQDDHVKNLSFLMKPSGEWTLTPAYDITFAFGANWTSEHQMRVRDKTAGIRTDDLLSIAREFDIKKPGRILDQAREAILGWEEYAEQFTVPKSTVTAIRAALDKRAKELAD